MSEQEAFIGLAEQLGAGRVFVDEDAPDTDTSRPVPVVFELELGSQPCRISFDECCGRSECNHNGIQLEVGAESLPPARPGHTHHRRPTPLKKRDSSGPVVELRPERAVNRAMKALSVDHEVQTGDAEFDDKVYIDTEVLGDEVQASLKSSTARAAVLRLLETGARDVLLFGGSARVEFGRPFDRMLSSERLRSSLEDLAVIARATPSAYHLADEEPRLWPTFVTLALPLPLWLLHACSNWCGELVAPHTWEIWLTGFASVTLFLLGALIVARGRSDSSQNAFWATCFFALVGAYPAGHVATNLNVVLDRSSATRQTAQVERYEFTPKRLEVVLRSTDGTKLVLAGNAADMADVPGLAVNATVEVASRPGRLGWPWIEALTVQRY